MKNFINAIILLLSAILLPATLSAQEVAKVQELELASKILGQKRPLLVYTPQLYNERDLMAYDVIYVFDAQNRGIFDAVHAALSFSGFSKKYIVVGITSPAYAELEYYRNSDYLPVPVNNPARYGTEKPNAGNFWRYVQEEVFPLIESKYRTTATRFAVGHSLSASFVLDRFLHAPEVFRGCIAISPNFAYDEYRLANDFINNDFKKLQQPAFLYTSQANEALTMPEPWKLGYEKVKGFIDRQDSFGNYTVVTKEFPEENHWNGYLPSLAFGLKKLSNFVDNKPVIPQGAFAEVTFTVTVPDKADDAYLTGNQESLGNWDPAKIKMAKVSDFERMAKIKVQFPVEFKITRGNWDSEAATNQNNRENIVIAKPPKNNVVQLVVEAWFDK